MLASILALVIGGGWSATPSADVWVYPHASSPGAEAFLRVWGDGNTAIDAVVPPGDGFSYGYLLFDLKDLPGGIPKKASLVVWNVVNDELSDALLKEAPLEVFALKGDFKEDTFSFTDSKCQPVGSSLGKAVAERSADGIRLTIDLMDEKGEFAKLLETARAGGSLGLAIASRTSPADSRSAIYKVNSKEGPEKLRPSLTLEFE